MTEAVLLEHLVELGGEALRPRAVTDLAQADQGVTATLDDGAKLRARYLVVASPGACRGWCIAKVEISNS